MDSHENGRSRRSGDYGELGPPRGGEKLDLFADGKEAFVLEVRLTLSVLHDMSILCESMGKIIVEC